MQLFRRIPKRGFSHATWDQHLPRRQRRRPRRRLPGRRHGRSGDAQESWAGQGAGRWGTNPRNGRADQEADGQGAPLLEVRRREDRGQGRHGRGHPAAQEAGAEQDEAAAAQEGVGTRIESRRRQGDKETRRQGEPRGFLIEFPSRRRLILLVSLSRCLLVCSPEERVMFAKLKALFVIPELRQKILFTLLFLAIYRIGYSHPAAVRRSGPDVQGRRRRRPAGQRPRLRVDVQRRQPEPDHDLRPGHHALHLRVDHLPAPGRRLPAAGKAAEGRRERPQEDQRIHALRHRRSSACSSPSCTSTTSWAAAAAARAAGP